jgi:hypothetical protein
VIESAQLYAMYESGATGSWEWVVTLSPNEEGRSFRVSIDQVLWDAEDDAEGAFYELPTCVTGDELFEFIDGVWNDEHGEGLTEEAWQEIEVNVRKLDARLAEQLHQFVQISFGHEEAEKSGEQLQIDQCIEGAIWKRNEYSGGGAMWAAIADSKRMREAISTYVRTHHAEKRQLPEGKHLILDREVTFQMSSAKQKSENHDL